MERTADHVVTGVPGGPQIREEPRNVMYEFLTETSVDDMLAYLRKIPVNDICPTADHGVPGGPQIREEPRNYMSGRIRLLLWFLLVRGLGLYAVPDGPQIRVIREEPRNDMSGRINAFMERTAYHVVIEVPGDPQIREEPRNDMSGRINNLMNAYMICHAAILTSVFSVQAPIGEEIWRSVVLLSGAVSLLIILLLLHIYFQQFNDLTNGGRGEPGLLNSLVQNSRWITERSAFVLMLMILSICLLYTYSRLLLSRIP